MKRIEVMPFFDSTEFRLIRYKNELNRPKPFFTVLEVTDTASGNPLTAQLYNGADLTYSTMLYETDETGSKTISFLQDTSLLVYRMGYHPQLVHFNREGSSVKKIKLSRLNRGEQFILEHIYFATNSNRILLTSMAELQKLARFLEENPTYKIEVQGHTNGQSRIKKDRHLKGQFYGDEKKLSRKRALAVKAELHELGIGRNRIRTKGFGGERMLYPLPKNASEHDRNKRVEIVVL